MKGVIGVQPYLGGGAVYDDYNEVWRSKTACAEWGDDDPWSATFDIKTSCYTNSDMDINVIPYGAYFLDALLNFVFAADALAKDGKVRQLDFPTDCFRHV